MPDIPCKARHELEQAVVEAVMAVYSASPVDRGPARLKERDAVRALREHIEQRRCKEKAGATG